MVRYTQNISSHWERKNLRKTGKLENNPFAMTTAILHNNGHPIINHHRAGMDVFL
jgi:hypothetical protein